MKRIAFFSIPAHGHTNPMLPVATELVARGNRVRFYSFDEFEEKINKTGAEFVSCSTFLPELSAQEEQKLKRVSTTEMTLQDIRITLKMDEFLSGEIEKFKPDVIYTDSVCFWGKLTAWKYGIPMVVSTSTFAFNQLSSGYMKHSPAELWDMISGLSAISRELKKLEAYGYRVKNPLSLVQNDNNTDTVVYTSERLQPFAKSFSGHYCFAGPSVFLKTRPEKDKDRPLIYISLGTVINDRPDFYKNCVSALGNMDADVIISCGSRFYPESLGTIPGNIRMYPYVDQTEVLSRADVFITHCGMNSVSESLYMSTPMLLFPQTGEQYAVAKRVMEMGAGEKIKSGSAEEIKKSVQKILCTDPYMKAASECCNDLRSCKGSKGAAEFIEKAPHTDCGVDPLKKISRVNTWFMCFYWTVVIALVITLRYFLGASFAWIIGVVGGIMSGYAQKAMLKWYYKKKMGI